LDEAFDLDQRPFVPVTAVLSGNPKFVTAATVNFFFAIRPT